MSLGIQGMDLRSWQMTDIAAGGEGVADDRWHELTKSECFALLAGQRLGRVVLVDDRGPAAFPVNFVIDRHTVLFRTDEGTKLKIAGIGGRVAFEIDATDQDTRAGWSVLVRGEAVEVTDPDELTRVRKLALVPWAPGRRTPAWVAFGTGWLRHGPRALFAESVRMYQPLLPVLDPGPGPLGPDHGLQAPPLPELRLCRPCPAADS